MNNKISKNVVPENFKMSLAFVDLIPVVFFALTSFFLGAIFKSWLFMFGAVICFLSGFLKVLWKILVVKLKRNIWPLFVQMRIFMPIGFLLMIVASVLKVQNIHPSVLFQIFFGVPQIIFFILGILGMVLMIVFAFVLDSTDLKSNWIEQLTNGFAQICFFIGVLFVYLGLKYL